MSDIVVAVIFGVALLIGVGGVSYLVWSFIDLVRGLRDGGGK